MNIRAKLNTVLLLVLSILSAHFSTLYATDDDGVSAAFQRAYARWLEECRAPEIRMRSDLVIYSLPAYKEIVGLGFPALPAINEKLAENPMLVQAVFDISKKKLSRETRLGFTSHSKRIAYAREWMVNGHAEAATSFVEHVGKYRSAKRRAADTEVSKELQKIRDLGTAALPHVFSSIAVGEVDLIPIASELLDGEIPPTATEEQCAKWWRANKDKWTLPTVR